MQSLKGPTVSEIKKFIKEEIKVEFNTINNKTFTGKIIWFDDNSFHLVLENGEVITLSRNAIAYYCQSKAPTENTKVDLSAAEAKEFLKKLEIRAEEDY